MMRQIAIPAAVLLASATLVLNAARAHNTPPVTLVSDQDAVKSLLSGSKTLFVREVNLTADARKIIQSGHGWKPSENTYPFYIGRDADGKLVAASVIMAERTMHGPIRVAVGITPDGKVKDVQVVQVSEEILSYMRPLLERNFAARYTGLSVDSKFERSGASAAGVNPMGQHYDDVVSRLVQRALILYDVGIRKSSGA
jgi:hypothetical protein